MTREWAQKGSRRWVRSDGAVVMWDDRTPYANPENPRARMWTAWEPDPSEAPLCRPIGRRRGPAKRYTARRFASAEAAMVAVDKEFP